MRTTNALAAILLAAISVLVSAGAHATVVYRETFNVGSGGQTDARDVGWTARRNGGSAGNPCNNEPPGGSCLAVFPSGSTPMDSVGNDPVFSGEGNAFYSP
jgi:hypothetical protein